ncbi:uncharacterized protein N7479_000479 [Penicillium vulpinum]|uniref:Phosphoribosylaminoimidazole-succinocarboxamide synthase n=1 Tax=Penicillium vulpinum TaxID=29845 RepID=A0A1V6S5M5_9EURO|nr:uncharacterized protein N7479_000479 [Penicillium vulpinum]KAJ5970561.1 hypothetical protein N7479_000479 [Penicillium vulpinum]OQE09176.1 hypothetical protein PENVUL_c007G07992 [Penicillium vulpinum]
MSNPSRNFSLRNVNTSKPQLARTESQQSAAASDDYYSFSDQAPSSPDSLATIMQFRTANSHVPSPAMSQLQLTQEDSESQRPPTSSTVRFVEDRPANVSPISDATRSDGTARQSPSDYPGPSTTPGLDDSPYVRFAIDQITQDRTRGIQRTDSVSTTTTSDYPTDRLVWDEGLGYFTRTRTPIRHDIPPTRPSYTSPSPQALPQRAISVDPESFIAVDAPEQSLLYPPLDYLPLVLRPWALAVMIFCCLLMMAGIVFCNVWSRGEEGLWDYARQGGSRYFVLQFLPQIAAIPIIIWSFVIQAAIYRIAPFAMMSAERQQGLVMHRLPILSKNFIFPDLSHLQHGEALFGISLFTIWLSNFFAIPLLSCLFQAKYYVIDGQGVWRWASVQSVGWALVALYGFLTLGLVMLFVRFVSGWSGLMWDPVSLADLVSITQRSNILHDFEHSEIVPSVRESLDPRILRLGYWKLSSKAEIFYGIGEVDAPVRTPSLHQTGKSRESQPNGLAKVRFDLEHNGAFASDSQDNHLYSPTARYRWTPWFLRKIPVFIWIIIVFALFIAFVAVSFINDAIEGGFPPKLPTLPSADAFSSSNFLYSFLPALIGNVLFLAWQPIDVYFRALQPYAELSSPSGASAQKSILLSYPSSYPIQVTIQAVINRHFKVAWISVMSLLSIAIPVLAGGVFIALWYSSQDEIRISAFLPAFYALIGFCGLYAVSFLAIWPGRRRYLPHDITTLADLMSYLYQSPLLADKLLREPRSKTDLVTRLIIAPPSERDLPMYGFGIYVGRDGKEHLGIDRFHRPGRTDMLITTGTMK